MKTRLVLIMLGLMIILPNMSIAAEKMPSLKESQHEKGHVIDMNNNNGENKAEECDCEHQENMHRDWQDKMAEREQKLLSWVAQYTPDKKEEWNKVLAEKKELRNKWLSPELAEKREKWKQEKMAKIQELKKQLEAGKITKEEFVKQAHGGKKLGHWKTFHELKIAIENKNDKQAGELLNQLLEQTKEHNAKLKEMINK